MLSHLISCRKGGGGSLSRLWQGGYTHRRTFRLTECAVLRESPIACPRCWAMSAAIVLQARSTCVCDESQPAVR